MELYSQTDDKCTMYSMHFFVITKSKNLYKSPMSRCKQSSNDVRITCWRSIIVLDGGVFRNCILYSAIFAFAIVIKISLCYTQSVIIAPQTWNSSKFNLTQLGTTQQLRNVGIAVLVQSLIMNLLGYWCKRDELVVISLGNLRFTRDFRQSVASGAWTSSIWQFREFIECVASFLRVWDLWRGLNFITDLN